MNAGFPIVSFDCSFFQYLSLPAWQVIIMDLELEPKSSNEFKIERPSHPLKWNPPKQTRKRSASPLFNALRSQLLIAAEQNLQPPQPLGVGVEKKPECFSAKGEKKGFKAVPSFLSKPTRPQKPLVRQKNAAEAETNATKSRCSS